jgi:HD superfamily phosphodiesterase
MVSTIWPASGQTESISETTGANRKVVELFALFHDSCWLNESDEHGPRGALLAESLRGT